MKKLEMLNSLNDYKAKIREKVSALYEEGKISEALKDEFFLVDNTSNEVEKNLSAFLEFMKAVSPENLEDSMIPEDVSNGVEYIFKNYKSINFSTERKTALIYTAYQTSKSYLTYITQKYMEILETIADIDTECANIMVEFVAFAGEQQL